MQHHPKRKLGALLTFTLLCYSGTALAAAVAPSPGMSVPATDADGNYQVSWTASPTPGALYVVEEATNAAFSQNLRKAYDGDQLSIAITNRDHATKYFYRVKAKKFGSTNSSWTKAADPCVILFSSPAPLTVPLNNAEGTYTVTWAASNGAGVNYTLQEAIAADFSAGIRTVYTGTDLSTAIDTTRAPGKTSFYRVRATKSGFPATSWTEGRNGCQILKPAKTPASITVPATDLDGIYTVSWAASATSGAAYQLEESTDADFTTDLRVAYSGPGLSTSIFRPEGQQYFYRVKALKDGLAASPWRTDNTGVQVGTVTGQEITIDSGVLSTDDVDPTLMRTTFHVSYVANGTPVNGLTFDNFRFYMSEYVPGAAETDPGYWHQWLYERASSSPGLLTANGNGSYTYQFSTHNNSFSTANSSAPDLANIQRLSARISGSNTSGLKSTQILPTNGFHDFLMANPSVAVASPRDIAPVATCNSCHGPRIGNVGHGGGYNDTRMCVNCHSPLYTGDDMVALKVDFTTMIHQIHSSIDATLLGGAFNWSEVTYPQDILNCAKCHQGTAGDNWKTVPSRLACSSCHTAIDFTTGANHEGGIQTSDAFCADCHRPGDIIGYHMTINKTPNNPATPAGAAEFSYHIYGVTVNGNNEAVVDFAIKKNGANLRLGILPSGFSGSPSFLLAYAMPQDGIATPAEYNNLGKNSAQPDSVSVTSLIGTAFLTENPNVRARYTATLAGKAFPAGATLRAIALQGYFTQTNLPEYPAGLARHAEGVVKAVTGDAVRRTVVAEENCLKCHEIIEGHGGNRINNPQLCVFCHNPNLSSSGRTFNLSTYVPGSNENTDLAIAMFGADSSVWPEASNNFKDMIHGIHGGEARTYPFQFVRVRSGAAYPFDWSEVTFPNNPAKCEVCHLPGTYELPLSGNNLNSTNQVAPDGTSPADVTTARLGINLPGAANLVTTPIAASCTSCHNSDAAVNHVNNPEFGFGSVYSPRATTGSTENCVLCHGKGEWMDLKVAHGN